MRAEAERRELDYIVIRQYKPSDYESLSRLYLVNWPTTNPWRRILADDLIRERGEKIFVAENGGEMVGSIYYTPRSNHANLHSLVVKIECRGQGIAAEMLKIAHEQADNDGFSEITIAAESDELIRYYESLGFRRNPNTELGLVKDVDTK